MFPLNSFDLQQTESNLLAHFLFSLLFIYSGQSRDLSSSPTSKTVTQLKFVGYSLVRLTVVEVAAHWLVNVITIGIEQFLLNTFISWSGYFFILTAHGLKKKKKIFKH